MNSFHPIDGATAVISGSTSSARAAITKQPTGAHQIRLANGSGQTAYYRVGDGTVAATTSDIMLPSAAVEVITVLNRDRSPETHVAVILAAGSGNVHVTTGHGL
jgi:hypothetical protein